jgi:hypothetical protein
LTDITAQFVRKELAICHYPSLLSTGGPVRVSSTFRDGSKIEFQIHGLIVEGFARLPSRIADVYENPLADRSDYMPFPVEVR